MALLKDLSEDSLRYIINHVILPPKLPQGEEADIREHNFGLLRFLARIARDPTPRCSGSDSRVGTRAKVLLETMAKVHDPDAEFPRQVMDGIMGLANGDAFALHVFRQNAGVIIRRVQDDLRFEVFEASPIPAAVVGCKGRLRCNFPGPVTAIPCQVARDPLFLNELGNFLQHMDTRQFTEETLSKSRKGGNDLSETRDTADPRYIIELLTGIMRGIGKEVETVNIITKNLRDEVNWKSALSPWRRSGLWLVVRVGLQTTLGRDEYKFFMLRVIGAVLAQAIHSDIDSYSISCIRQKLARRAFKLGEANIPQELLAQTLRIAQEGHSMLSYRWSQTIAGSERLVQFDQKLTTPASVLDNTYLKLRDASAWIENRITAYNSLIGRASSVQDPQELARHVDSSSFPQLRGGTEIESAISLIDFELWVQQHLEAWCSGSIRHSHGRLWVIEELAANIKQYHKEASKAYTTHSLLDASKMALTILEMWIELDKLVCEEEPLLSDYSPEIPINILDPILLVQRGDMDRVVKVEDYLRQRHTTSRVSSRPSMFDEKVSAKSFAVNYYNQSSALKNLRSRIVRQAESDKERKKQELLRQNQEYKELMADSQLLSCDYGINQKGQSYHCKWCDKCACKREAGRLTINPHEWPLPAYETDIKAVLFELQPPKEIVTWRDITYYIMVEVCTTSDARAPAACGEFHNISEWKELASFKSSSIGRVTWVSGAKAISSSHYSFCKIPSTESSVLLKHGGQYRLFDAETQQWIKSRHQTCTLAPLFKSSLVGTPYNQFSYAVNLTTHSHNKAISDQYRCPKTLTLHEYDAFTSLRVGEYLQWHNILIELHKGDLKFNADSIFTLILHAACQTGSTASELDWRRKSHITLSEESFSEELLKVMHEALSILKENWEQANALKLLALLARRLVSCGHNAVKDRTIGFLKEARKVCFSWMEDIQLKLQDASEPGRISDLQDCLLRVSAIQCNTFDIDPDYFPKMFGSKEDVVEFLACQIIVYENCMGVLSKLPKDLKFLLMTTRRFALSAERYIHEFIRRDSRILSDVLCIVLPTQERSGTWQQVQSPADRWWRFTSFGRRGSRVTVIHLDIIQGRLLIDGQPNGRLPSEYLTNTSYIKLLKTMVLDVMPSTMGDMSYQTTKHLNGFVLHFHLEDSHLIIRKVDEEGRAHEYIPGEKFDGEIPRPLVEAGSQWLDLDRGEVEFYQSSDSWTSGLSQKDWLLRQDNGGGWVMGRGTSKLLDIAGNIHAAVGKALQPIEASEYIITTVDRDTKINVDLPQYGLKFFVNQSNEIECDSLKGWVVDRLQSPGTFIGLRSFLKLKSENKYSTKECVLVPFGSIKTTLPVAGNHSEVEICPAANREYTVYQLDKSLNRVLDNGSLQARYTRIYLHCVTSGILADPLTGRTGIDEALDLLRNAASYSFQELTGPEASILDKVACLTPSRNFYPEHLRNMQTVCWADNVPTWVQHDELHPAVQAIFEDWNRRQFLAIGSECQKITKIGTPDLLERARNNNSVFRCGDPCAVDRRSAVTLHTLRHQVTDREAQTQDISRASFGWHEKQDLDINFTSGLMAKSSLPGYDGLSRLRYGPEWFGVAPSDRWCTLYELCRRATVQDRFGLLFIFSAFVYQGLADRPFLKSLLAIATSGSFTSLPIPHHRRFELGVGLKPSSRDIQILLQSSACSYRESPYYHPLLDIGIDIDIFRIDQYQSFARKYSDYETELEEQAENAAALIVSQWPSLVVVCPQGSFSLLNIPSTLDNIQIKFQACYQNHEFSTHLNTVIEKLWSLRGGKDTLRPFKYPRMRYSHKYMNGLHKSVPSLRQLLEERRVPESLLVPTLTPYTLIHDEVEIDNELNIERVITVANNLRDCSEMFAEEYSDSLLTSIKALQGSISCRGLQEIPITLRDSMREHHREAIENVEGLLRNIRNVLSPITELERLQETCGLWPDINKLQLLHRLRLIERRSLPASWQKAIIVLGEAITWEQRAGRLVEYAHDDLVQEFDREVRNPGRQNWNVVDYIDWLLLELDSEMLIRPVQATIGLSMMDDSEDKNAVMQLNMGEGKSAMILPAVAAALADTTRLVRPIVLKPLSTQMFQILVQRLSGLCDRRIYLLPIWRTAPLSREMVQVVRQLYEDCMNTGGIMLTLPEHILSFKLMGIEKMLRKEPEVSEPLIACQKWLTANARDILDESDEILHTRYQLIYTMGNQQALEGNKDRWAVVQELLDFVQERAIEAASQHPTAIEVGPIKGVRYRTIRIIDRAFGERMLQKITNDICMCDGRKVPSVSSKLKLLRPSTRKLAQRFMSMSEIAIKEQETLLEECNHIRTQLMVLRGLVAHGLLLFVLRDKRYRVDYGLDRTRSSLAVPYRAKDRPAVKAEFGHPEVMLILTCLSYYYGGLQNDDLQSCFELIGKSDNPELVYEHWTKRHPEVPSSLSKLRGINLLDLEQVQKTIFPFFRYNKSVIDFFLAELIFPREAKNFPYKLSTSAWDIVEKGGHNTTGFSGTNDNRRLLPTSIQQLDLPEQTHTNSLVLKHILLEENSTVFKIHRDGRRLEADEMIAEIVGLNPKVRVTLDVGAQILELNNQEVAQTWLKHEKSSEILGAVYFGDNDKLLVMKRNGKIEPFTSSALSKQLDRVLVFLDEAHTRGTDLKLPVNTRAAVTLGPNLPKDKFVQGCMRMRKLGNGHSLVFLAPPDIYTHVQISAGKNTGQEIDTSDVLLWTMIESCRQIQHGFSIWADQGLKYLERSVAWGQFKENKNVSQLRRVIMEAESRPLEEMYGVGGQGHQFGLGVTNSKEGIHIFQQLDQFDVKMTRSVAIHEEQEREVDHEVEVEIHKELPGPAKSNDHSLHPDVMALAASGVFNEKSEAFSLAYDVYKQTSAKSLLEYRAWKSSLYATKDFLETIKIGPFGKMDNFLRPVRWILSVQDCSKLILLSPYEANELMPVIRKGTACCLHCYSPRVTQTMRTLEFLDLCATPALPQTPRPKPSLEMRISLNIFAGQLFFHDEGYYRELCQFLGLYYGEIDGALQRKADGWINTRTRRALCLQGTDAGSKFARSPIPFLSEAIKMRRKGQGFSLTHLGSVLNARTLGVEDF